MDPKWQRLLDAARKVEADIWASFRPGEDPRVPTDLGMYIGCGVKVDHYEELKAAIQEVAP